jgi:predicted unusual protein kinase regulating ubiquinone biosynthesis (AarF/ABC1/UbiB family)
MPSGKLGLIDYGQVKLLKPAQRRSLARIIVALADGKEQEVIDLFVEMGFRSKVRGLFCLYVWLVGLSVG